MGLRAEGCDFLSLGSGIGACGSGTFGVWDLGLPMLAVVLRPRSGAYRSRVKKGVGRIRQSAAIRQVPHTRIVNSSVVFAYVIEQATIQSQVP